MGREGKSRVRRSAPRSLTPFLGFRLYLRAQLGENRNRLGCSWRDAVRRAVVMSNMVPHPFKVYDSVIFSATTRLCNHLY